MLLNALPFTPILTFAVLWAVGHSFLKNGEA